MGVAQGVSPGTTTHRPPPAVGRRQRRRHTAGEDSGGRGSYSGNYQRAVMFLWLPSLLL